MGDVWVGEDLVVTRNDRQSCRFVEVVRTVVRGWAEMKSEWGSRYFEDLR